MWLVPLSGEVQGVPRGPPLPGSSGCYCSRVSPGTRLVSPIHPQGAPGLLERAERLRDSVPSPRPELLLFSSTCRSRAGLPSPSLCAAAPLSVAAPLPPAAQLTPAFPSPPSAAAAFTARGAGLAAARSCSRPASAAPQRPPTIAASPSSPSLLPHLRCPSPPPQSLPPSAAIASPRPSFPVLPAARGVGLLLPCLGSAHRALGQSHTAPFSPPLCATRWSHTCSPAHHSR